MSEQETVWYGPHQCGECGAMIVKAAKEDGGAEFDYPSPCAYPNHQWEPHVHRAKPIDAAPAVPPVSA